MERLTVLGAGSVRYAPAICGGLACYFGERPLEIRFWDPDAERLDLFDRFARYLFKLNKTPHSLMSTDDATEAIFGTDRIVIALDEHSAELAKPSGSAEEVIALLRPSFPDGVAVLDLRLDASIPEPDEDALRALPHEIIRYLHGDEYAHDFLKEQQGSPVREWLLGS